MTSDPSQDDTPAPPAGSRLEVGRLHLRFGWWAMLAFLALGILLEGFHGLKTGWYLDVSNQTRRLMWTLAHAHGTLLALVNVVYGLTVWSTPVGDAGLLSASRYLLAGNVLLPMGFFIGGIFIYDGDPGLGILLVPVGGLALLAGVLLTARASGRLEPAGGAAPPAEQARGRKRDRRR